MADESQIVLSEAIQRIKNLMSQEKWLDAHRACLEILRFDPENLKIIRLKNKVEKQVKKINIRAIKEDIKNIQPLWKEKKYGELLEHLKELEPYRDEYKPLDRFIKKVQKAYLSEATDNQKEYYEAELKRIEQLAADKKFQEAIRAAQKLRIARKKDNQLKQKVQRIKDLWVEQELKANETLFKSEKYEDALLKAQEIKKIDLSSQKIEGVINSLKKKYQQYKVMEKRDFIYKGLEKAQTLLQLKKYDKAMQVAQEILGVDPENKKAQYLFSKAKRKLAKSTNSELRKQMKKSQKNMKEKYKKDKNEFIKI